MDALLARGRGGLMDPLTPGVPVDTHTGTRAPDRRLREGMLGS